MKALILGDIHFPYHSKKALDKVVNVARLIKPTHIIQVGDLYDQYSFSRFSKKNLERPIIEMSKARKEAEQLWVKLKRASRALCFQILGNHDIRLIKRLQEKLPEAQEVLGESFLKQYYSFPGVKTIYDDREELVINGINFIHGYRSRLGDHCKFNGVPTVVGHSHVGGVVFEQRNRGIIWELNAGYLADETSEPLRYRPQNTSKWTLGYGIITKGRYGYEPQFIPLE